MLFFLFVPLDRGFSVCIATVSFPLSPSPYWVGSLATELFIRISLGRTFFMPSGSPQMILPICMNSNLLDAENAKTMLTAFTLYS